MKTRIIILVIVCLALTAPVLAQSSANYDLSWHVIAGGGGRVTSTSYALLGSTGQPLVGTMMTSGGHTLCSGFWCSEEGGGTVKGRTYLPLIMK